MVSSNLQVTGERVRQLVAIMEYTGGEIRDYRDARPFNPTVTQADVDAANDAFYELKAMGLKALPMLRDLQTTNKNENVQWIVKTTTRLILKNL
jgi:hypothetical protein